MNIIELIKKHKEIVAVIGAITIGLVLYKFTTKRIILFYSDGCGHCQKFKPEWERIKQSGLVSTQEYNCGENSMSCNAYGIRGYPTILVENGFSKHEYQGERTLESIVQFYNNV